MRLEHVPLILGVLIGILGVALVADAWIPDDTFVSAERRRRQRAERHRTGEGLVGIGTLCLAAALIGRDTWRYGTLSILIGAILLAIGVGLNHRFLRELLFFRGPARRAREGERVVVASPHASNSPAEREAAREIHRDDAAAEPRADVPGSTEPTPPRLRIR